MPAAEEWRGTWCPSASTEGQAEGERRLRHQKVGDRSIRERDVVDYDICLAEMRFGYLSGNNNSGGVEIEISGLDRVNYGGDSVYKGQNAVMAKLNEYYHCMKDLKPRKFLVSKVHRLADAILRVETAPILDWQALSPLSSSHMLAGHTRPCIITGRQ